jgi:hypothetical protein
MSELGGVGEALYRWCRRLLLALAGRLDSGEMVSLGEEFPRNTDELKRLLKALQSLLEGFRSSKAD